MCSPRSRAETSQDFIGWEFLLEGLISHTWAATQTEFYKKSGMRKTGLRWTTQLLLKFWGICWDLWNIRNEWEHKTQLNIEADQIRSRLIDVIYQGSSDLPHLQHLYTDVRLHILQHSSIVYQKAWLLNLHTSRQRAKRKSLPSRALSQMQLLMNFFLDQFHLHKNIYIYI